MEIEARSLYLELIKRCLVNYIYGDAEYWPILKPRGWLSKNIVHLIRYFNIGIVRFRPFDKELRIEGRNWPPPPFAHSMMGLKRLNNLQTCIENILDENVPGDFIEAGVWRGGGIIFMRAMLKAYGVKDRIVWGADSFQGLPKPNQRMYPYDVGINLYKVEELSVSLDEVKRNMEYYGLLDNQVNFIEGWFSETLPTAPIKKLALMRLDGDMYESIMDSLKNLYPKLSGGGYVIIDDYGAIHACRQAVEDFRSANHIVDQLEKIDYTGVYWKRTK